MPPRAGAWAACGEVWPETREQRCWNHKIVNVLDALPKKLQAMARELLCAIPYAPTRAEALERREQFAKAFRRTHPRAVEILERDWERMVAFYDFPRDPASRGAIRVGAEVQHWCVQNRL